MEHMKDPYPELKVPQDFRIKFEVSKGFEPGESMKYAPRTM